ncbi:MAG: hypothetical protein U0133_10350 [Gemmatimonadales bacterium]
MKALLAGLVLTGLVALAIRAAFGPAAMNGTVVFGVLATLIQLGAIVALRRAWGGTNAEFLKAVAVGMGLRLGGVVVLAVAMAVDRGHFPPLPTALGFLGVLIPLLFLEVRFVR